MFENCIRGRVQAGLYPSPMKVILASASPRRTELLNQVGIPHEVLPSRCEEKITSRIPEEVVKELSAQKAQEVFERYAKEHTEERFLVIGADTVVSCQGKILGKPKDEEEAFRMLSVLQGNWHEVYTGVTLIKHKVDGSREEKTFAECSRVQMYPIGEEEIRDYIATGEPMDKAGSYGIQGCFAVHIRGIQGDYSNIVGLPVARIYQELKTFL